MKKPVIGIVAKQQAHKEDDLWHRQEMVDELRILIIEHGGIAVMLLPSEDTMQFNQSDLGDDKVLTEEELAGLRQQVDLCDGIILQGGDYSSQYEVEIGKYAIEKDIPLMGICAGFNNVLRALGSNVYEDVTKSHSKYTMNYRHSIDIIENTKMAEFFGTNSYEVNSMHTMLADKARVEPYATISSYSYDGLVESFELPDKKFVVAMKWHPELMMGDEFVDRLFDAFIGSCK